MHLERAPRAALLSPAAGGAEERDPCQPRHPRAPLFLPEGPVLEEPRVGSVPTQGLRVSILAHAPPGRKG